jgi:hypothetical protein
MTFIIKSWYNAQGILDSTEVPHTYIVKTNAINLFIIGPQKNGLNVLAANQAIFDAKANVSECIGGTVTTVDGNSPLHVTMTDAGTNGTQVNGKFVFDQIGVTYYRSSGGLYYSNNWNGTTSLEQPITQGEVVVCSTSSKSAQVITPVYTDNSNFMVYPNPFSDKLRFEFIAPADAQARIDLFDMTGRMVQTVFDNKVKAGVEYNAEFKPVTNVSGMYFYRATIGQQVFNGKVNYQQ